MQIRSLSLTVLLAIVGTACKRQPAPEEQAPAPPSPSPQAVASATPKADTVGWGWDSPETVRSSGVRYTAPMQIFDALGEIGRAHVELQSRLHLVCRLLLEKKKKHRVVHSLVSPC